jgi:hypothetical protein
MEIAKEIPVIIFTCGTCGDGHVREVTKDYESPEFFMCPVCESLCDKEADKE